MNCIAALMGVCLLGLNTLHLRWIDGSTMWIAPIPENYVCCHLHNWCKCKLQYVTIPKECSVGRDYVPQMV